MTLTPDQRAHLDVAHALDPNNNPDPEQTTQQQSINDTLDPHKETQP